MAKKAAKRRGVRTPARREYEFELVLSGFSELTEEIEDALYEAGCDDGTLGISCGVPLLTFAREAATLREAVLSAVRDVESAGRGIRVEMVQSADCGEYCSMTDIARRIGKSRELVRKYSLGQRGPGGFPQPVGFVSGQTHLFRWSRVAAWLLRHRLSEIPGVPEEFDEINAYLLCREVRLIGQNTSPQALPASVREGLRETRQALAAASHTVETLERAAYPR